MANRAYLFFIDQQPYTEENREHVEYFDSRHNVPFCWFLFFTPEDLSLLVSKCDVNVPPCPSVYLIRPWANARALFLQRMNRLFPYFPDKLTSQDVEDFLQELERYSKSYLVMDPYEIDHYDSEEIWRSMLTAIGETNLDAGQQYLKIASFTDISNQMSHEKLLLNFFGYNYS